MAFSPSLHSLTGKAMGMSQATPTDARSYFFDETNFVYRAYVSTAEVLAYLTLPKYRTGNFSIFINDTGTLNPDGTITGGTVKEYTFLNGVADLNLGPVTIQASNVVVDSTHRFATDAEKTAWNAKADIPVFTTLAGTTWDLDTDPYVEKTISADTTITLAGGTGGQSSGMMLVTNTGSFTLTVDGNLYEVRPSTILGGITAISVIKMLDDTYYVSSDYAVISLPTPSAPTTPVTDDVLDTFGWTDTGGLTFADAEYSINGGSAWADATANPQTGITGAHANGQVQVRYKAVPGVSNASAALSNTSPFTGADVTDPTVTSMEAIDANTIEVTLDEVVDIVDETGWVFDNGAPLTITGVAGTGTAVLTFTISETMLSSDTITGEYDETTGNVEDQATPTPNRLQSFGPDPVTNSIGGGGLDADAVAFINAHTAAGGSLSAPEQTAISDLVVAYKANGTWTKKDIIYPQVGTTGAQHAINLKNPSNFLVTWSGAASVVHTATGTVYVSTNDGYGDTGYNAQTNSPVHMAFYSRTSAASVNQVFDMGASTDSATTAAVNPVWLITRHPGDITGTNFGAATGATGTSTNGQGYFVGEFSGGASFIYRNGTQVATQSGTPSYPNLNLYIGALNGGGTNGVATNKESALIEIGATAHTPTEIANDYTAVQAFQTAFSRQV